MRKNKFFDSIMICLVLMIAVKVMFPNAFGCSGSTDNPVLPPVDTSHMVELPVFDTIDKAISEFESQASLDSTSYYGVDENSVNYILSSTRWFGRFYSTVKKIQCAYTLDNPDLTGVELNTYSSGIPLFYVGDVLYYLHTLTFAPDCAYYMTFNKIDGEHYYFPYYYGA